jgi:hypothetical protein
MAFPEHCCQSVFQKGSWNHVTALLQNLTMVLHCLSKMPWHGIVVYPGIKSNSNQTFQLCYPSARLHVHSMWKPTQATLVPSSSVCVFSSGALLVPFTLSCDS